MRPLSHQIDKRLDDSAPRILGACDKCLGVFLQFCKAGRPDQTRDHHAQFLGVFYFDTGINRLHLSISQLEIAVFGPVQYGAVKMRGLIGVMAAYRRERSRDKNDWGEAIPEAGFTECVGQIDLGLWGDGFAFAAARDIPVFLL